VRLTSLLLVAVWSVSLCVIAVASLPYSPVSMALGVEISVKSLLPEGWGFFTRTPRAIDLYLYRHTYTGWRAAGEWPISQPVNVFGLNPAAARDRRPARAVAR
jgi:Sporulation delaying protein SdpA